MIRIMICRQQRFAQNCLSIAPGNPRVKINFPVGNTAAPFPQIFPERGHTSLPCFLISEALPSPANILRAISEKHASGYG